MVCNRPARLWLEILSAKGIGATRWIPLVQCEGLETVVEMLRTRRGRAHLARRLGRTPSPPDRRLMDEQQKCIDEAGCRLVSVSEASYPTLLREIPDPPPLIYLLGDGDLCGNPKVCIVGSRSAGRRGIVTARALAAGLSRAGVMVVSGLARGIDRAAHIGALEGEGSTCAVLGCGVDICYPSENASLAARIAERGVVISELPLGTAPLRHNFPRRNRILSGLSIGVVVVEAGLVSGAMVTARLAREQNRELFAVPGPVENPMSKGPHALLKQGAGLVETVDDILMSLQVFGFEPSRAGTPVREMRETPLSDAERSIVSVLELDPKHIDELVQICNISPTSILPILLNLEMRGVIVSCGGGTYALPPPRGAR
jgi:DNA processing protein